MPPPAWFSPAPAIRHLPLPDDRICLVVDGLLSDPLSLVAQACAGVSRFQASAHAYPGHELRLDHAFTQALVDHFLRHLAAPLGVDQVLAAAVRLSLVTRPETSLDPRQWFCHRDHGGLAAGECLVASVLYLFEDEALGGTSFYRPRRTMAEVEALVRDSLALRREAFRSRYPEIAAGYLVDGNAWFERVAWSPARFNRALFYDGSVFHSGDIRQPARMLLDPRRGRLTLNAFLRCRRAPPRPAPRPTPAR